MDHKGIYINTAQRIFGPATCVDSDCRAAYVDIGQSSCPIDGKITGRCMAEEADLAMVISEEFRVALPTQCLFVAFGRMLAATETGVHIISLLIIKERNHRIEELHLRHRFLEAKRRGLYYILAAVLSNGQSPAILGNKPEQISKFYEVEQHLLVVTAQADKIRALSL